MSKLKISGKELRKIGYPESKAIGMAINVAHQLFKREKKETVLATLKDVLENQEKYASHEQLSRIVAELQALKPPEPVAKRALLPAGKTYKTYGLDNIEQGAIEQMDIAMRLPVTVEGALMPDAHQGYGLPIGGV
ncbi:MAG: hypothetical protein AAB316_15155 [Bacteroidota bacterium]